MVATFDQGFLKAVADGVFLLADQKESKLLNLVRKESKVGEYVFFDRADTANGLAEVTTNKATTSLSDIVRSRRGLANKLYMEHLWTDKIDEIKSMNDPASHFSTVLGRDVGKTIDDIIIDGALGDALTGKDGGGTQALPSSQKIAVGFGAEADIGLTVEKLIEAARILDANEIDDMNRIIVVGAKAMSQLLNTTKATSADFNSVRALVAGQIDTFMGFKFIKSQRLGVDANDDNRVIAFHPESIVFNMPAALEFKAGENMDKNYLYQASVIMSGGAVRIQDEGVVEIACDPVA